MKTAGYSIGDRVLPLEADVEKDFSTEHPLVGKVAEVSCIAGGELLHLQGKNGKVKVVLKRLGVVVGYGVEIDSKVYFGSLKDFYVDRVVLEDIEVPTPTSEALTEGLSHWGQPRTYWGTQTAGVESLMFEVAAVTPRARIEAQPGGWKILVPDPMPGRYAVVDCRVASHGTFWTLAVMVYPELGELEEPELVQDHWDRTFLWTYQAIQIMMAQGMAWKDGLKNLSLRVAVTVKILRPTLEVALARCLEAKKQLTGQAPTYPPGSISAGVSPVRLKAGTVGLSEPPTDRRPYAVLSFGAEAAKSRDYFNQVVLHEALHAAIYSNGGPPHGKEFQELAAIVGIKEKYRD